MDIIEPVTLGDVAFTRPSPKWVFDRTGALVQVPAGSFAVSYDPSDLTKAPYAVAEAEATNLCPYSTNISAWTNNGAAWTSNFGMAPDGTTSTTLVGSGTKYRSIGGLTVGADYTFSEFVRAGSSSTILIYADGMGSTARVAVDLSTQTFSGSVGSITGTGCQYMGNGMYRVWMTFQPTGSTCSIHVYPSGGSAEFWGVQFEAGKVPTSYIGTSGSTATRSADVIASGAGLVYSNVPITEPDYNSATTYAKDAVVHDPATHNTYESIIAGNVGKALTDTSAWAPNGVTNRWAMLDQYNNTQTTNAEEIIHVLSPQTISQGFYVGNVDASEVRVAVTDLYKGLVYQETQSLRVSNSESSFFNWCFRRKRNRTWAVSLKLRPYANALVTITIKKPGGAAKCGMCVVGPTMDLGRTLMTLGAEIKDFSDTSFNFDGTSKTTIRNWAKRISADVVVDASRVDDVYEFMASYRQRPLVWIGSPNYGLAIAYGRYSGIKPVVKGKNRWDMSMQIEGTV